MKEAIINKVIGKMGGIIDSVQLFHLKETLDSVLSNYQISQSIESSNMARKSNNELLEAFLSAKKIEGCSEKTE